jgi:hypothetical protein
MLLSPMLIKDSIPCPKYRSKRVILKENSYPFTNRFNLYLSVKAVKYFVIRIETKLLTIV